MTACDLSWFVAAARLAAEKRRKFPGPFSDHNPEQDANLLRELGMDPNDFPAGSQADDVEWIESREWKDAPRTCRADNCAASAATFQLFCLDHLRKPTLGSAFTAMSTPSVSGSGAVQRKNLLAPADPLAEELNSDPILALLTEVPRLTVGAAPAASSSAATPQAKATSSQLLPVRALPTDAPNKPRVIHAKFTPRDVVAAQTELRLRSFDLDREGNADVPGLGLSEQ